MRMDADRCREHLAVARHGVFGTVHVDRGVDAVPVVFVVDGDRIVIPIDTVKPKGRARLQRLRNLEADARAVLLVDRYDDDWSQLWWVRVHGHAHEAGPTATQLEQLAAAFPPYSRPDAVSAVIVLVPDEVTGWAAGPPDG